MPNENDKVQPVKNFKFGAVSVAVWENETKQTPKRKFYTIGGAQRTYKQGDDFKTTPTLRISDIPDAVLCLQKAYEWAKEKSKETGEEVDAE